MNSNNDYSRVVALAQSILDNATELDAYMKGASIRKPSLQVGAATELWSLNTSEIETPRNNIFGLSKQLNKLLEGPHGYLHDLISPNWELGALYTVLEFDILDMIPLDGETHVSELSTRSELPQDKLLSILRLLACEQILKESSEGSFHHTAISEELVRDKNFKAWIGFELFETRIASAHLADSLKQPANSYQNGQSAFKHALGKSMYEWHAAHPEKGARFGKAMQGVTQTLDPGNDLFHTWFSGHKSSSRNFVIDTHAKNPSTAAYLAANFPNLSFQVQLPHGATRPPGAPPPDKRINIIHRDLDTAQSISSNSPVLAYLIRNVLWNCSDDEALSILQGFLPALEAQPEAVLLVNEMLSPAPGTFDPHVEIAYRRRDVTTMTMHNAEQRNEGKWRRLFAAASPHLEAKLTTAYTSHSFRGLWELRWTLAN